MNNYCEIALDYLSLAFDRERALFSYSSSLDESGQVVNDWRMPESLRYTINTYLGLVEAERHDGRIEWLGDVEDRVREFLDQHERSVTSAADLGLLLVLLAATDPTHPAVTRSLERIERLVSPADAISALNMQDMAWMLWGASSLAEDSRAAALAHRLFELITTRFVNPASGLPRHMLAWYRSHQVSFGSVVYYLRSMYEYSEAFRSETARELFSSGVQRVLSIQGSDGGWPWMIDIRTGEPFDLYPIFTVHQDSMAMLFLLPAQRLGIEGVSEAIERSLRWNFGPNDLAAEMVKTDPCPWIYRSIERAERWPRMRRYLRSFSLGAKRYTPRSGRLRVNPECRSYHLGWVLYAWSDPINTPPLREAYSRA